MSIVRENLMTRAGYSPYCGSGRCSTMPRTRWTGQQFECGQCGWLSSFPADFIAEYKAKWHAPLPAITALCDGRVVQIVAAELPTLALGGAAHAALEQVRRDARAGMAVVIAIDVAVDDPVAAQAPGRHSRVATVTISRPDGSHVVVPAVTISYELKEPAACAD